MRAIRKVLFLLVLAAGLGVAVLRVASFRAGHALRPVDGNAPEPESDGPIRVLARTPATTVPEWVEPVDGACPDGFPVKAKAGSGIYHVPGGRSYTRTSPDRCYATPAAAEADGYRPAKA